MLEIPIDVDLSTGGQILTYKYRGMLKAGRVQCVLGSINHFVKDGIVLTNGTVIPRRCHLWYRFWHEL